ncbi:HPr(Ser) kinase/phosphatase [Candidatus Mycoplasma haematohominis]|uniref:HPr kinase/phosphorylase n=1 Tax=Candidatus Mycoplasma haematohominis TaxID=1494318 RepID=A0A478FQM4_9MOLU|nr:HPr(Ser) kinase/phosphatase [Candidatus Mycoplasma haemohominis]GCE63234.1 HPr kinase/phosphorylase [Candidatus Mycoplasma haemohominis]
MKGTVKVNSIYKRFKGNYLNRSTHNADRQITIPSFTRLGFELNGIFLNEKMLACVCWGAQESEFLNRFPQEQQIKIIKEILVRNPPLFILSKNFSHSEVLLELNQKFNENRSAIIHTDLSTTEIYTLIGSWLSKTLATWKTIHGTVLNIWGEGVLIIGDPGVGKSETASELIRLNHLFLGDDAISVTRIGNIILAKANPLTKDFIHLRGLGILNIKEMYGGAKIIRETNISVVIELKHLDLNNPNREEFENVGDVIKYYNLLGVPIPLYTLPVTWGRNMCDLIELAVIDMKLKQQGYNAAKEMDNNYKRLLIKTKN